MVTKTPSWANDFAQFIADSQEVAYADLAQHFSNSAWKYRLQHRATIPSTSDGAVFIETEVHIGPAIERLEYFDTVVVKIPGNLVPVTSIVRQNLTVSLLATVFGRFPEQPAVPVVQPGQMNGGEAHHVVLDRSSDDVRLPGEDGGEYVNEGDTPAVDVVARREPDGLPIFVDLYAMDGALAGATPEDIVAAVLDEIAEFARSADSVEQLAALPVKNTDMIPFMKDFGTDADRATLKNLIETRRRELTVPAAAAAAASGGPRRRARTAQN